MEEDQVGASKTVQLRKSVVYSTILGLVFRVPTSSAACHAKQQSLLKQIIRPPYLIRDIMENKDYRFDICLFLADTVQVLDSITCKCDQYHETQSIIFSFCDVHDDLSS